MAPALNAGAPAAQLPPDAVVVVEIMGQSNSWGTKSYIHEVPNQNFEPLARHASIWDKIGGATANTLIDDGEWAPLTIGFGRSGPDSFGPEMKLAERLFERFYRPIYVIKCSRGETALAELAAHIDWHPNSQGEIFELWRDYYHRPALDDLVVRHGADNIYYAGLCWFQGAADAENRFNPAYMLYESNLHLLLSAFRTEVGAGVPISIGRSENYVGDPIFPHINVVRLAQMQVAAATPDCEWYSTDLTVLQSGNVLFPFGTDGHHFNGRGQVHLGAAMANTLGRVGFLWPYQ